MGWPLPSGRRRAYGSHMSLSIVVACLFSAGWLPQRASADTYDIGVNLYTDANCLFWAEDFVLLDGGCYANRWAPNASKGFKMNIVYFNSPQKIDMREFEDDCHTLVPPKRTVTTGTDRCTPFLGSMYAQFDIRFRSNTCKGQMCSTMAIAIQTFFKQAGCVGMPFAIFRYPVQGECLRANNGTQDLTASADDSNLTLVDYAGSDDCKRCTATTENCDVRVRDYFITNQNCYPLYTTIEPRSFSWVVERPMPYAVASDGYRFLPGLLSVLFLVMGVR